MLHPARFPYKKPPRGTLINRQHPLARGMVGCWILNEGTGKSAFDLINHVSGAASADSWVSTDRGIAFDPASSNEIVFNYGRNLFPNDIGTVLINYYRAAMSDADRTYIAFGLTPYSNRLYTNQFGTDRIFLGNYYNYVKYWNTTSVFPKRSLIYTFDAGPSAELDNWNAWLDGKKLGTPLGTGSISARTHDGQVFIGSKGGTVYLDIPILSAMAWDRFLTDAEIKALSANPYLVFYPSHKRSSYFNTASSGTTRNLVAGPAGQSTTPSIAAITSRILAAAIDGAGQTPDILATTLRTLAAAIGNASQTPVIQAAQSRALAAAIAGQSLTPDISAMLQGMISFVASISGSSATPGLFAHIARSLASGILGQSGTPAVSVTVLRALLASMAGGSTTPDNLILLLAGLGLILDPSIDSLTIQRTIRSLTVQRTIHCL